MAAPVFNYVIITLQINTVYFKYTHMCRKLILAIILLIGQLHCSAQHSGSFNVPDYAEIKKVTTDPNSSDNYSVLLKRYNAGDTTLSVHQMELLYYGWFFNDAQLKETVKEGYLDSIRKIHEQDVITQDDKRALAGYYQEDLKSDPFKLSTLNALANLYAALGDPRERTYAYKLITLVHLIMNTGDGTSVKSGFHVNNISDEYTLLAIIGLKFGGSQSLVDDCDYLNAMPNNDNIKGVYFNVAQVLLQERKAFGLDEIKLPVKPKAKKK